MFFVLLCYAFKRGYYIEEALQKEKDSFQPYSSEFKKHSVSYFINSSTISWSSLPSSEIINSAKNKETKILDYKAQIERQKLKVHPGKNLLV